MNCPTAALGEIAKIERNSVAPTDIASGSRYVGLEHIESGGGSVSFGKVASGELASNKFRFGPQHILFGKLRPYLAKIVCPDFDGICSTDILPIAPGKRIDQRYLLHFLRRPQTIDWAASRATGVNLPRLSPNELASLEIPLPPLDEQRRIAAILDKADDLRRKRKRALGLLDGLTQSIFLQMSNSDSQKLRIGKLARIQGGKRLPKGHDYCGEETGYKYLRVTDLQEPELHRAQLKNLREETFQSIRRYVVNEDDVVITIAGTIGVTRHIDAELAGVNLTENAAKIVILDRDHVDSVYLSWALRSEAVQSQIRTSTGQVTIGKLALFRIEQLEIDVPKIEQQRQFRHILEEQQKIRRIAALALGKIDLLFSSLQHRAFSCQL